MAVDEEVLNQQLRKFLKKVGVNSQREIEQAVRTADADGRLESGKRIQARMRLELPELGLEYVIEDQIAVD